MKRYQVRFADTARDDLARIFDDLLVVAGEALARSFVDRLIEACLKLEAFPARGTVRDEVRPGLRLIGYRRQATIAFVVREDDVIVLRVFRRGQDTLGAFAAAEDPDDL